MLSATHSLVGASAGKYIPSPVLALLAGIFLHFVFDKVPHFWPSQKKYENMMLFLDTIVTVSIISFFVFFPGLENRYSVAGGALGGAMVDFFLVLMPYTKKSRLSKWHSDRQTHLRSARFILNDVVIMALSIVIIFGK
ncbi:hypothetical protein C4544_00815 [candidate division WS5 bacterium]|uniref:DUF3307 domain-containing protein n=1 Tax=candidate division WS5 bacterium TaxID=2093353 RepID=A0A419DFW7_9BACT|nr:MAG: hypothetical protein C4544_00815 [candidate division WS5 bacterium]